MVRSRNNFKNLVLIDKKSKDFNLVNLMVYENVF